MAQNELLISIFNFNLKNVRNKFTHPIYGLILAPSLVHLSLGYLDKAFSWFPDGSEWMPHGSLTYQTRQLCYVIKCTQLNRSMDWIIITNNVSTCAQWEMTESMDTVYPSSTAAIIPGQNSGKLVRSDKKLALKIKLKKTITIILYSL